MNKLLDKVDLPQEVKDGISSRSVVLSARFHLDEQDLVQEGLLTVYSVLHKNPNAPLLWIMKAINNCYSDIMKKGIKDQRRYVSWEDPKTQEELDNKVYKEVLKNLTEKPSPVYDTTGAINNVAIRTILWLKDANYTYQEIAELMGTSIKTIRKALKDYEKKEKEHSSL